MAHEVANFANVALRQHAPYFVATMVTVLGLSERLLDKIMAMVAPQRHKIRVDIVAFGCHRDSSSMLEAMKTTTRR